MVVEVEMQTRHNLDTIYFMQTKGCMVAAHTSKNEKYKVAEKERFYDFIWENSK